VQRVFLSAVGAMLLAAGASPAAAVVFTGSYSENFNSLATTGTSSATPAGWSFVEGGANANTSYTAGTGSSNAGDTYSYGTAGSSDRALGTLTSGNLTPARILGTFSNGGATALTSLTIGYTGEMWRLGNTAAHTDTLAFEYSINGGAFTALSALNFSTPNVTAPAGAKNGNGAGNFTALSATISGLDIGVGQSFVFRWTDTNIAGDDDGLAIDDFSLAGTFAAAPGAGGVPEPATWGLMIAGFGLAGGALRRRRATA